MDILSLSKASKALKQIQDLDTNVIAKGAESRFKTVDARLDWIEAQASKIKAENSWQVDWSQGTFDNVELVDGTLQLKLIRVIEK